MVLRKKKLRYNGDIPSHMEPLTWVEKRPPSKLSLHQISHPAQILATSDTTTEVTLLNTRGHCVPTINSKL
jgi:hypothetical protein